MLSRGNSDAAVRLRRAKSTSSVPRRGLSALATHSDPLSTHNNALTAATSAFERANGIFHIVADYDVAKPATTPSPRRVQKSEGSHLARVRPSAGTKDRRVIKAKAEPLLVVSVQHHRPASPLRLVPQKSFTDISQRHSKPAVRDWNITSKSSKLTPPSKINPYRFESTPTLELQCPPKTAFLTSGTLAMSAKPASIPSKKVVVAAPSPRAADVHEVITNAVGQDKYLRDNQSNGLAPQSSSIAVPLKPRHERPERGLRQPNTTRNDKNVAGDTKINKGEDARQSAVQTAVEDTTRALQSTFGNFKRRLKNKFEQASTTRIELPFQQVEAKREHFGRGLFINSNRNPSLSEQIMPNISKTSLSQGTKRHSQSQTSKKWESSSTRSHQTLRSLEDMSNLRSRVTSWANSSGQNTIAMAGGNVLSRLQEPPEASKPLLDGSVGDASLSVLHREKHIPLWQKGSNFDRNEVLNLQQLTSLLKSNVDNAISENQHAKVRYKYGSVLEDLPPCGPGSASPSLAATTVITSDVRSNFAVRPIQVDFAHFGGLDGSHEPNAVRVTRSVRAEVMSPSIYSVTPADESASPLLSNVSLHHSASIEDVGIALVAESHHVSKWTLGKTAPEPGETRIVTSNEWRTWASGEVAELDCPRFLTTTEFSKRQEKRETSSPYSKDPQNGQTSTLRTNSKGGAPAPKQVSGHRLKITKTNSSQMNDRFPMLNTGRRRSNHSAASSRRTASSQSCSRSQLEHRPVTPMVIPSTTRGGRVHNIQSSENNTRMEFVDWERPDFNTARMTAEERGLGPGPRKKSVGEVQIGDATLSQKQPTNVLRDVQSNNSGRVRRKAIIVCSPRSPLDEKLVTRIRMGPYASPSPAPCGEIAEFTESFNSSPIRISRRNMAGAENTPPSSSRRMVDDFLSSRSSLRLKTSENDSPVFL